VVQGVFEKSGSCEAFLKSEYIFTCGTSTFFVLVFGFKLINFLRVMSLIAREAFLKSEYIFTCGTSTFFLCSCSASEPFAPHLTVARYFKGSFFL